MSHNILILAEARPEGLRKVSLELVTIARGLVAGSDGRIEGVVLGSGVGATADAFAQTGIAKVYVVDHPALAQFAPESYATAFAEVIRQAAPSIVLLGATGWGKEVSARTAAKLDWGLVTDCTKVEFKNGELLFTRPIYAGKVIAHVKPKALPVMASMRPNLFPPAEVNAARAPIETLQVAFKEPRARVVETVVKPKSKVDLSEAKIVVSGGRGVKGPEGFVPVRQLADTLGGAVGASRAAVDAGWIDYSAQVGQTGKTVSPQLYIAAGISGAIQHLAGMSSSKVIVAVNKDPDAPIFKVADYGIVGDLFEVLPAMDAEFKRLLAEG